MGRLVATTEYTNTQLRQADAAPFLPWFPEIPSWPLGVLALAGGVWLLIFSGVAAEIRRRPLAGTLSATLVLALVTLPAHGRPPQPPGTQPIVRFYVADPIGSAIQITDNAGAVRLRRQFEPYGEVASESTADPASQEWFGGQRREERSGLFDFRARWYDSRTGGFLSQDPMIGNLADPQQHNAYAYARGNPVNRTDPTGLTSEHAVNFSTCPSGWDCSGGSLILQGGADSGVSNPWGLGGPSILDHTGVLGGYSGGPGYVTGDQMAHEMAGSGIRWEVGQLNLQFGNAPSQGGEARYTSFPLQGPNGMWFPNPEAQQAFGEGIFVAMSGVVGRGAAVLVRGAVLWRAGFTLRGLPLIVDESVSVAGGPTAAALALRQTGYNARSIFEIFGRGGITDPKITALAERIGARVVTYDKGAQVGQGFGQLAIRPKVQLRDPSELVRFVEGALGP